MTQSLWSTRKRKKNLEAYTQGKKEHNTRIEKNFQKFVQNKERRKIEKKVQYFQKL